MADSFPGLLGRKVGMTRVFGADGTVMPVTVVKAGPCVVTHLRTTEKDGYSAVQVGYDPCKDSKISKAELGHLKKSGGKAFRHLQEFRLKSTEGLQLGGEITVSIFAKGEHVKVSGVSRGKGFQGVIRRHGHRGGKDSHGSMFHRAPGSSGAGTSPGRVLKGREYPGHMGAEKTTIAGLEVVDVRPNDHLLLIRGGVPGAPNGLLTITRQS